MKKRIVFLSLTIAWMALIFWFSSKTAADSTTQSMFITERIIRFFISEPSYKLLDFAETFVRKAAHFSEYFILGALVFGTVKSFEENRQKGDKMKYNTYLFDFDGTLVDSMPSYVALMLRILDENKIEYSDDIVKIITPLGYGGTAKYFINMGLNMPEEEIIALMNKYAYDEYAYNIPAKENVINVLRELKSKGANLNVLTASPHRVLDPCLKRLGIWDLFTNVWSCEDFNTTKADPQIYVKAAEKIGEPIDEILFLDDNYNADCTAKQAGIKVCGVYDKSSDEYAEEIKSIADHYIYDFNELL